MSSPDPLTRGEKQRITRLRRHLLQWYAQHGRSLPWRAAGTGTFERICVEVLLQRTRAETVAGIYEGFFSRFRSWADIAETRTEDLEELLRPIGLWKRRALSLKGLASYASRRGGVFPDDTAELSSVPAVGQYVQNAILLFQHGQPRPLLDVNMARLLERYIRPRRLADIRHDPWLQEAAHWLVKGQQPIEINWSVLDFGSLVCTARRPGCSACLVFSRCRSKGALSPN